MSPLLANIALAALDEHVHGPWLAGGTMSTPRRRARRRAKGLPNWRIVRYADDFVILVHGTRADAGTLREDIARVLEPLGLRLSEAKTQVVHVDDGFDFLGFRIRRKRKRGTAKWYVYTFIAARPVRALKDKIRALTRRTSQQPPRAALIRINQIMRGWANYFRHAVCKHTMNSLDYFAWRRVIRWQMKLRRWKWKDVLGKLSWPRAAKSSWPRRASPNFFWPHQAGARRSRNFPGQPHFLDAKDRSTWGRNLFDRHCGGARRCSPRGAGTSSRNQWKDVRRSLTGPHGRWLRPNADGIELFNIAKVPVTRYRYRGSKIPSPWTTLNHA